MQCYETEGRALSVINWLNRARNEKTAQAQASVERVRRLLELMQKVETFHKRSKRAQQRGRIERLNRMRAGRPARPFRGYEALDGEFEIEDLMSHYTFIPDLYERRLVTKDPGFICGNFSEGQAVCRLLFFMEKGEGELWRFGICGTAFYSRMHGKRKQAHFCSDSCRVKHYRSTKKGKARNAQAQARFRKREQEKRLRERANSTHFRKTISGRPKANGYSRLGSLVQRPETLR